MKRVALWTPCLLMAANAVTLLAKNPEGALPRDADAAAALALDQRENDYVRKLAGQLDRLPNQQEEEEAVLGWQGRKYRVRNGVHGVRATAAEAATPAGLFVHAAIPLQTPPPIIRQRQSNDGQVAALSSQIQSLSDVASSISQASRMVSQTSQQLAQQVTQLSQSSDRLSKSIQTLQQSAQQAQQAAQQAQDAARQASQSASDAIRMAQLSAASSASSAIAANLASITSSAGNAIAAVRASAIDAASMARSQVQSAQADATVARVNADTQVQQAQGAAVSVTQTALAVVGTFVGSVLVTVLAVYLILQRRRKSEQRQRSRRTEDLAGRQQRWDDGKSSNRGGYDESVYSYHEYQKESRALGIEKEEARKSNATKKGTLQLSKKRDTDGEGFGFATFGPYASWAEPETPADSDGNTRARSGGMGLQGTTPTTQDGRPGQAITTQNHYAVVAAAKDVVRNPTRPQPSLQQWLSEGTISPFGTLKRDETQGKGERRAEESGWPFERRRRSQR